MADPDSLSVGGDGHLNYFPWGKKGKVLLHITFLAVIVHVHVPTPWKLEAKSGELKAQ